MTDPRSIDRVGSGSFLLDRLREEVARATRHELPLACVLFQVRVPGGSDGATADRVAHAASVLARHMVRDCDVVADLGCGHFGVVANATGEGARTLAGLLARELCAFDYTDHGRRVEIVLASGVASLENGKTPRDLLEEARAALELSGSRALPSYC